MRDIEVTAASEIHLPSAELKPTSTTGQRESALGVVGLMAADAGVWECESGTFTADRTETAEVCTILSGRAVITTEGAAEGHEIGPGSLFVLPRGWRGTWVVTESIRKTYVLLPDEPVSPRSSS